MDLEEKIVNQSRKHLEHWGRYPTHLLITKEQLNCIERKAFFLTGVNTLNLTEFCNLKIIICDDYRTRLPKVAFIQE